MPDITDIFLSKWRNGKLAHFYILKAPHGVEDPSAFLEKWPLHFLGKIIKQEKGIEVKDKERIFTNYPDILAINPASPTENYRIDDFSPFFSFLGFKNYEFSWRFIIIFDSHKINEQLSNKLLKSLEEPTPNTTIFFLRPDPKKLLPTIEGRAIKITLPDNEQNIPEKDVLFSKDEMIDWVKEHLKQNKIFTMGTKTGKKFETGFINYLEGEISEIELIEKLKGNNKITQILYSLILDIHTHLLSDAQTQDNTLKEINWFQKASAYRNSPSERIYSLLRTLPRP